jgi:DNA-binding PadR family transcriptional regulator
MAKKKLPLLTTAEVLALTAAVKLVEANNIQIFEAIQAVYPQLNFPTIYTALVRMTWKGYLTARTGDPQPVRGGRARKYYTATAKGKEILAATHEVLAAAQAIPGRTEAAVNW